MMKKEELELAILIETEGNVTSLEDATPYDVIAGANLLAFCDAEDYKPNQWTIIW